MSSSSSSSNKRKRTENNNKKKEIKYEEELEREEEEQKEEQKEEENNSFDKINFNLNFLELSLQSSSRILHCNPVCFLTTINLNKKLNVMPISWLSPANNYGGFTFIIHKSRSSASNILENKEFYLSIAQAEQKSIILLCGKVSGNKVNKFDGTIPGLKKKNIHNNNNNNPSENPNLNRFAVFNDDSDSDNDDNNNNNDNNNQSKSKKSINDLDTTEDTLCPISDTVAYLKCHLLQHHDAADPGHWLMIAQIDEAFVHPQYWDGKCFCRTNKNLPPLLSFIGSQRFSYIIEEN